MPMFDKVKAAGQAVIAAAGGAGIAAAAGVDWGEVVAEIPGPEFIQAPLVTLIVGGIAWAAARWKKETKGYGAGVPKPPPAPLK